MISHHIPIITATPLTQFMLLNHFLSIPDQMLEQKIKVLLGKFEFVDKLNYLSC